MEMINGGMNSCILLWCRYVYLVDSKNRVRWSASGKASLDEAQAFVEQSKELFKSG